MQIQDGQGIGAFILSAWSLIKRSTPNQAEMIIEGGQIVKKKLSY